MDRSKPVNANFVDFLSSPLPKAVIGDLGLPQKCALVLPFAGLPIVR